MTTTASAKIEPSGKIENSALSALRSPYDRLASVYDTLAWLYSGGGISASKRAHLNQLRPGESVLYVGAGTGAECFAAASLGASVTVVDSSKDMLTRCAARFLKSNGPVEPPTFLFQNALTLPESHTFDVVVAPYFLNTIAQESLENVFQSLGRALSPGGRFICVDFRGPSDAFVLRQIQRLYYLPPLSLFHLLTGNPWHPLYDYRSLVREHCPAWQFKESETTRAFGLPLLETLTWTVP